jgi:hypothetical protein
LQIQPDRACQRYRGAERKCKFKFDCIDVVVTIAFCYARKKQETILNIAAQYGDIEEMDSIIKINGDAMLKV